MMPFISKEEIEKLRDLFEGLCTKYFEIEDSDVEEIDAFFNKHLT